MGQVNLAWTAPTTRQDGSALAPEGIASFVVRHVHGAGMFSPVATIGGTERSTQLNVVLEPGTHIYDVLAVDTDGRTGAQGNNLVISVPLPVAAPAATTLTQATYTT